MKITIEVDLNVPVDQAWSAWTSPEDITAWNFASDDWCCPSARIDLTVGGKFNYRMESKDGAMGFDLEGVFTYLNLNESIHYKLDDDRQVTVEFQETSSGVKVIQSFEAEGTHTVEQQREGWQSILNNFKRHVENKS